MIKFNEDHFVDDIYHLKENHSSLNKDQKLL